MSRYGTTKAARIMEAEDREKDVLRLLAEHLRAHPMEPTLQVEALLVLRKLDRRSQ